MRDNRSVPLTARLRRGQVCVAHGFGIRIRINRQHLIVDDGVGRDRRTRRYARATHGLSRLVVIGNDGYITLDAVRWLTKLGIGFLHLDRDGTILATTETGSGDARLRRIQALAPQTQLGVEIGRYLLGIKVAGQARNLDRIPGSDHAQQAIRGWEQQIVSARSLNELLEAEREAAAAYWSQWAKLQIQFVKQDLDRIPEHWKQFGTRQSLLTSGSRAATTPANAILNYLYAILEAETRIAILTLGLDPGLGIWHVDYRSRDSLALDLMEAARPNVDSHVLTLLTTRTLTRKDVGETSRGICRLLPPLAQELAQTSGLWREAIAPHAEHLAEQLATAPGSRATEPIPTPLTQRHRQTAGLKGRPPRPPSPKDTRPTATCRRCGIELPNRDRTYCDTCFALPQHERRTKAPEPRDETTFQATITSSKRCKTCSEPVAHRKRIYCDPCFNAYEESLVAMRRKCKACDEPTPNRKRVYCDDCAPHQAAVRPTGNSLRA